MAHPAVVSAIHAHLDAANWSTTECPIVRLNTTDEAPADNGDYLEAQFIATDTDRPYQSDRMWRERGAIRFVLLNQRGIGVERPLQRAQRLAALFRDQTVGGVHCEAPDTPDLGDFNDNGTYFVVAVIVPYWFDYREE
jgi:hypothetical protein